MEQRSGHRVFQSLEKINKRERTEGYREREAETQKSKETKRRGEEIGGKERRGTKRKLKMGLPGLL